MFIINIIGCIVCFVFLVLALINLYKQDKTIKEWINYLNDSKEEN